MTSHKIATALSVVLTLVLLNSGCANDKGNASTTKEPTCEAVVKHIAYVLTRHTNVELSTRAEDLKHPMKVCEERMAANAKTCIVDATQLDELIECLDRCDLAVAKEPDPKSKRWTLVPKSAIRGEAREE